MLNLWGYQLFPLSAPLAQKIITATGQAGCRRERHDFGQEKYRVQREDIGSLRWDWNIITSPVGWGRESGGGKRSARRSCRDGIRVVRSANE